MKRLTLLLLLPASCVGCGWSMDTSPVLQPGAFHERHVDERGWERIGVEFAANHRRDEIRR